MISELFSSLAAPVFAAVLFLFFLRSRSREINGGEASSNAATNDGTAGGAPSTHSSTGVPERATSSGPAKYAAADDGTAGGNSGAYAPTGVPEMATSSGPAKDAAANDGTAGRDSSAYTPTGVPEMATSSGPGEDAAANNGTTGGDSGAHTSTGVPEMSTSTGYDYEVFLSFRGPDTRAAFTDYLYTTLTDSGIRTFKDDEDLRKGEEFSSELLQAIKQSKILIPIFSKNYASSVWCLKEVVQMIECKKTGGQKIMPLFYDVAPAVVRRQTGSYGDAFLSHEKKKRYDEETMRAWKAALEEVSFLNGWDLPNMPSRREGAFTKQLTEELFKELKKAYLVVSDCLVSVNNHVDAIMGMIGAQTNETRIVGIHGMGGIGKTTTAKMIYNRLSKNFEGCFFLCNIREMSERKGIECLQNQLISDILKKKCMDVRNIDDGIKIIKDRLSNKRVLLLLDDLYERNHMDALAGERDWFGKGSKLIITTRNREALDVLGVDDYYELMGMDHDQSLQLFSKHAFRRDSPLDEYIDQSNRAIDIAGGLPLALEVIGSLLSRTEKKMWDFKLEKLENVPHVEVQSKLRISYDALDIQQQQIFLDVACLFIGYDKDILVHFWDESKYPEDDMEVLQNMSLIKITKDNQVWMHDQLRDLGREIVRQESNKKIEKQSRVWDPKEGFDLLTKHKGKKEIEALRLELEHQPQYRFTYEGFESLSDLRFLEVVGSTKYFRAEERLLWHESPSDVPPTNENSDLLPRLQWLSWSYFPPELNIANFFLEDVVFLNLSDSEITDDWEGWSHIKVMKKLKALNLSNCKNLRWLPYELGRDLASLEYLSLKSCSRLKRLPDSIENMESLIELDISNTGIKELPDSIGKLKNLKRMKMQCYFGSGIPDALWTIEKLEEIDVFGIFALSNYFHVNIGNCIYKNQSLRILKLNDAEIYAVPKLPESLVTLRLSYLYMDTFPNVSNLTNLKELHVSFSSRDSHGESGGPLEECLMPRSSKLESLSLFNCPNLHCLPWIPSTLSSLDLSHCKSLCSMEDLDLSSPHLKELHLEYCTNLHRLPRLPSSLSSLRLHECKSLYSMEDLSNLKNLSSLQITRTAIEEIQGLVCLENLRDLTLVELEQVKKLPDLSNLNKLRSLRLYLCGNLVEIQGKFPESLEELSIHFCCSLQKLPDLSSLRERGEVRIDNCWNLNFGEDDKFGSESESKGEEEEWDREDAESESESEGEEDEWDREDAVFEWDREDAVFESESEGEEEEWDREDVVFESESEGEKDEWDREDTESESESEGEDREHEYGSEGEDDEYDSPLLKFMPSVRI